MMTPTKVNGVITGRTIELDLEPGFPTGQKVLVTIEPKLESDNPGSLSPGEGLRRAFGAWAEEAEELDKYLEWSRQQRKVGRAPIEQ
jgi:hypothetical protein